MKVIPRAQQEDPELEKMFNFDYEKKIRDLTHKFGLTRQEAEGFLRESEDWFGLKQLFDDKKLRCILILLAVFFGVISVVWLYSKLVKNK